MNITVLIKDCNHITFISKLDNLMPTKTWTNTPNGYTHTPIQWKMKAFIYPSTYDETNNSICFNVKINVKEKQKIIYAIYTTNFAELLLYHLDNNIKTISISTGL